jgi:putative oxidoreductase
MHDRPTDHRIANVTPQVATMNTMAKQLREGAADAQISETLANRRLFPFVMLPTALAMLRICTAALFMAHAVVRVFTPGSIQQFGGYLGKTGIPYGTAVVYGITTFEVAGGLMMMLGIRTRYLAAGFAVILVGGIVLIHRHFGWFVGEHGTGGSEYSIALLVALLVIASADTSRADGARTFTR